MTRGSLVLWIVRAVGLAVIAVMAIGVARSAPPPGPQLQMGQPYANSSGAIAAAKASEKLNAKNTDNVYQQQVVNGWVARDYLEVQALQLDKLGRSVSNPTYVMPGGTDDRPVMLLMWAVLAIVWLGLTTPGVWPAKSPSGAPPHGGQPSPTAAADIPETAAWQPTAPGPPRLGDRPA